MRKIKFTIDKLEFVGSGRFLVGGRNCEDDLHKGDILCRVRIYTNSSKSDR